MSIESYVRAVPKVELHVHLEGAVHPSTVLMLAQRNGVEVPAHYEAMLRQGITYRDFDHFIEGFLMAVRCLKTVEDYELIVYEFGEEMARHHVRYAEVTFSPSTHQRYGAAHETYFSGLQRGRARVQADFGVTINWIFNIVRRWADSTLLEPMAHYTTGVAIEGKDDGVIGLGLGGAEKGAAPERFAPWFERALAAGLHSVPHAGELAGPESIWGALQALGAERIAHGVRAIEDAKLVDYLAHQRIPLDITPTSNIRLGVYPSYELHPLPQLYAAGVMVNVGTDDPALFHTTISDELALLASPFGLDATAIDHIVLNGIRSSFLPEEQRRNLEVSCQEEMARLKVAHL